MTSDPIVYCAVHDRPLSLCGPDRCREIMASWGLYGGPTEAERRAADELTRLTGELGLYGDPPPEAVGS